MRHVRALRWGIVSIVIVLGVLSLGLWLGPDPSPSASDPGDREAAQMPDAEGSDGPMTMNEPDAGDNFPAADGPPPDTAAGAPLRSRPLPAGPVARRALRWQPWSAESAITALSAVSGEAIRVVAPERPQGAGDRIAIQVAEADWPALRSELGDAIPAAVIDDLRQARERLGAARYVHARVNADDPTYEVGGDSGVATLRLYRVAEEFIDLELLSAPLSVSGDLSID